jgi:hypothetical protein
MGGTGGDEHDITRFQADRVLVLREEPAGATQYDMEAGALERGKSNALGVVLPDHAAPGSTDPSGADYLAD